VDGEEVDVFGVGKNNQNRVVLGGAFLIFNGGEGFLLEAGEKRRCFWGRR